MNFQGKLIKGIAGFYYVDIAGKGVYECKARGIFRKDHIKPLIGDNVIIQVLDDDKRLGNITEIITRKNELIRPAVSNIDQIIIVFAANNPKPSLNLLDKFLIMVEEKEIEAVVCFNKIDQEEEEELNRLKDIYEKAGYKVYLTSVEENKGLEELEKGLLNKSNVFAGPSGVGKSSILNTIQNEVDLETGEISAKIKRGKHTTRHAELICYAENSYVVDTPGFSTIAIDHMDKDDLKEYFIEFRKYKDYCKFHGCNHISEPKCEVKRALLDEEISGTRYKSYCEIYEELKEIRRKW